MEINEDNLDDSKRSCGRPFPTVEMFLNEMKSIFVDTVFFFFFFFFSLSLFNILIVVVVPYFYFFYFIFIFIFKFLGGHVVVVVVGSRSGESHGSNLQQ